MFLGGLGVLGIQSDSRRDGGALRFTGNELKLTHHVPRMRGANSGDLGSDGYGAH